MLLHQKSESFFVQPPQANACKPFSEAKTHVNLFHLFIAMNQWPVSPANVSRRLCLSHSLAFTHAQVKLGGAVDNATSHLPCHKLKNSATAFRLTGPFLTHTHSLSLSLSLSLCALRAHEPSISQAPIGSIVTPLKNGEPRKTGSPYNRGVGSRARAQPSRFGEALSRLTKTGARYLSPPPPKKTFKSNWPARGSRESDSSLVTTQVFEIFPANSERSERITTEGDS